MPGMALHGHRGQWSPVTAITSGASVGRGERAIHRLYDRRHLGGEVAVLARHHVRRLHMDEEEVVGAPERLGLAERASAGSSPCMDRHPRELGARS